jgi:acyl dehydratase
VSADPERVITDEMLWTVRARIGLKTQPRNPWVQDFNYDAIRHWAWGIGDDNPLWLDRDHGQASPHGKTIAPPTMLYAADHGPLGPGAGKSKGHGLPGIHGLHSEDQWEFDQPVKVGTSVSAVQWLESIDEKMRDGGEKTILQIRATEYRDEAGSRLAQLKRITVRRPRNTNRPSKFPDTSPWVYSDDELAQIRDDYESETRRGELVRHFDDVKLGDEIGHVVKGPVTLMSLITFWMGWGCTFAMTDKIAHDYMRDHPGAIIVDPDTKVPDFPEQSHWNSLSKTIGLPLGYDLGAARISWFAHLLTNWCGDHGFPESLQVRLLRPNWLGDTTWIRGKVVSLEPGTEQGHVQCELEATNQRGDVHATGTARIALPLRVSAG